MNRESGLKMMNDVIGEKETQNSESPSYHLSIHSLYCIIHIPIRQPHNSSYNPKNQTGRGKVPQTAGPKTDGGREIFIAHTHTPFSLVLFPCLVSFLNAAAAPSFTLSLGSN